MKLFIIRFFQYLFGFLIIYLVYYFSLDKFYNNKDQKNTIFIWGDSQAYQGIDINELRKNTNRRIYTAARHGAGVYDFLVFAEKVPVNSTVLVAISKPAQIRLKSSDRNRSPLSLIALNTLIKNNYNRSQIISIIKNNIGFPENLFLEKTFLYEYSENITLNQPIELFEKLYKETPTYLLDKQNIYIKGIKILKEKNCTINLISFPYSELLIEVEKNSPIKYHTDQFFKEVAVLTSQYPIDTLILDNKKQAMHDLTHLNNYGAKQVSLFISKNLKIKESSVIYIAN